MFLYLEMAMCPMSIVVKHYPETHPVHYCSPYPQSNNMNQKKILLNYQKSLMSYFSRVQVLSMVTGPFFRFCYIRILSLTRPVGWCVSFVR